MLVMRIIGMQMSAISVGLMEKIADLSAGASALLNLTIRVSNIVNLIYF